jgi:hypothetical protein
VEEEVDVDLGGLRAVRPHGEVAPVLLARTGREAPAAQREHELLSGGAPAERDDLARLLDAEVGERRVVQGEAGNPDNGRRRAAQPTAALIRKPWFDENFMNSADCGITTQPRGSRPRGRWRNRAKKRSAVVQVRFPPSSVIL